MKLKYFFLTIFTFALTTSYLTAQNIKASENEILLVNTGTINNKAISNNILVSSPKVGTISIKNVERAKVSPPIVVTFYCPIALTVPIKNLTNLVNVTGNYKRKLSIKFETGEEIYANAEMDIKGNVFNQKFSGNSPIDIFDIDADTYNYVFNFKKTNEGFSYTSNGIIKSNGKVYNVIVTSEYKQIKYIFPYSQITMRYNPKTSEITLVNFKK